MARQHCTMWDGWPRNANVCRRPYVVGLGTVAGTFLAAAMIPMVTASTANADVIDPINTAGGPALFGPIIDPVPATGPGNGANDMADEPGDDGGAGADATT
ncbi:MAG: hypothetical protein ACRDTN_10500, partial [Mycobacterium sp.]